MNARLLVSASRLAVGALGPQSWAAGRLSTHASWGSRQLLLLCIQCFTYGAFSSAQFIHFSNVVKNARCEYINLFRHVSIAGHLDILRFGLNQKGLLETSCACLLVWRCLHGAYQGGAALSQSMHAPSAVHTETQFYGFALWVLSH